MTVSAIQRLQASEARHATRGETGIVNNTTTTARNVQQSAVKIGAALKIATWNISGIKSNWLEIAERENYDIICLTETHDDGSFDFTTTGIDSNRIIRSENCGKEDRSSGCAIILSQRLSSTVMVSGTTSSRICYVRLRGVATNIFITCVYVPHKNRVAPCPRDTVEELDSLLGTVPEHDCKLVMGDFNCRLPRLQLPHTGRWCIHERADSTGDMVMELLSKHSLAAASTYSQPARGKSNGTFHPRSIATDKQLRATKAPCQIDYIITSMRYLSSVQRCRVRWSFALARFGRHFDHALLEARWSMKIRSIGNKVPVKDIASLKDPAVASQFNASVEALLRQTQQTSSHVPKIEEINSAITKSMSALPDKSKQHRNKLTMSRETAAIIEQRKNAKNDAERASLTRRLGQSTRQDFRNHLDNITSRIEEADNAGKQSEVTRLVRLIAGNSRASCTAPTKSVEGKLFTCPEEILAMWSKFLAKKFESVSDDHMAVEFPPPVTCDCEINREDFDNCIAKMKDGKSTGLDKIPIECYKSSLAASDALFDFIIQVWHSGTIPREFMKGCIIMAYKKGSRDQPENYRTLCMLNHSFKVLSSLLLMKLGEHLHNHISTSQAGFMPARGCRDHLTTITITIDACLAAGRKFVLTFIDFKAAFDSLSHQYIIKCLQRFNTPITLTRLVNSMFLAASAVVKMKTAKGEILSDEFDINRGIVQGDIVSPLLFILGLTCVFKDHDTLDDEVRLNDEHEPLGKLEFADDVGMMNSTAASAEKRLNLIESGARIDASLELSMSKTKVMHVQKQQRLPQTTHQEISDLKLPFICADCSDSFTTNRGLKIHKARWCRPGNPRSKKGTKADLAVRQQKHAANQTGRQQITVSGQALENVFSFDYLGYTLNAGGNRHESMYKRFAIARARFYKLRNIWKSGTLPLSLKLKLYRCSILSTFKYGCEAWRLDEKALKMIRGANASMLTMITRKSPVDECRDPSIDAIYMIRSQRRRWLGHILRAEPENLTRQVLIAATPSRPPYPTGSLLEGIDAELSDVIAAANNRDELMLL
jgi:exonuclease III